MSNLITPTLCIYHGNCSDGFGAAFVVWLRYGHNVKYVPANYGDAPPDCTDHDVLLVDFSYKLPELELILEQAKSVTILDHHKTAEADIQPLLDAGRINGEFDMNRSGAAMVWDWCYPGEDRPRLIEYIQDRDLWRFHLKGTKEVSSVLFSYEQQFGIWLRIMNDLQDEEARQQIIRQGEALQRKHKKDVRDAVNQSERLMNICGYTVPVANVPHIFASDAGNLMAAGRPFAATYVDTESGRKFSLRSTEDGIDVSEIARRFGGGGHARAAGFQVPLGWLDGSDHIADSRKMVHTCSYSCHRPECIRAQRDELAARLAELERDKARLDWLSDPTNENGGVLLPRHCVENNLDSMRAAVDAAMEQEGASDD